MRALAAPYGAAVADRGFLREIPVAAGLCPCLARRAVGSRAAVLVRVQEACADPAPVVPQVGVRAAFSGHSRVARARGPAAWFWLLQLVAVPFSLHYLSM